MTRVRSFFAVLLLSLLVVGALAPAVGAQEGNATTTPTQNESAAQNGAQEPEKVAKTVDNVLVIESYEFNESASVFSITFRNTADESAASKWSSSVTVTEAITREGAESGRFAIETLTVKPGSTVTLEIELLTRSPLGVLVTTQRSVDAGHGTYLPTPPPDYSILDGPAAWADVRAGSLFGILGALAFLALAAWQYVAWTNTDVKTADLEPRTTFFGRFRDD